jgi:tetratricopeptide (TPR) repeat protein
VDPKTDLVEQITGLDKRACDGTLSPIERERAENELFALWRIHDEDEKNWTASAYLQLGRCFRRNNPLLAYEVFAAGLEKDPASQLLLYQQGLTLARLGAYDRAREIADKLAADQLDDPELFRDVLTLAGSVNKNLALREKSAEERARFFQLALDRYQDAFDRSQPGYKSYPAINAATLALLLGQTDSALRLAKEARIQADAEAQRSRADDYWLIATAAEASFVLGEMKEAETSYRRAVQVAGRRFDEIGSMRRNARILAGHFGSSAGWVEDVLRIPSVVVFTGHMIDRPGRTSPRFPARLEKVVAAAIATELEELNAGFGFSGAACGSDILFLEAMMQRGHINIVLPFAVDEFVKTSVSFTSAGNWTERFREVLQQAENVQIASGAPSEWGGIVFEYANLLLLGLAQLRSRALDTELVGLAVWDGNPGDGPGGTEQTVKSWRKRGLKVAVINTKSLLKRKSAKTRAHVG